MSKDTGAILADKEKCRGCGLCIDTCPGKIPRMHSTENYAPICDLCGVEPRCVKVCDEGRWGALWIVKRGDSGRHSHRLFAKRLEEVTQNLVIGRSLSSS